MANRFTWAPQGSDGATQADWTPYHAADPVIMAHAAATFKEMVLALEADDIPHGQALWDTFVDAVPEDVNPYSIMIPVGVVFNAAVLRMMADDPDPFGAPNLDMDVVVIGIDRDTGAEVPLTVEKFAARAIGLAANWRWDDLNSLMNSLIESESELDRFLHELSACLMALFIGVGGSGTAGWRD